MGFLKKQFSSVIEWNENGSGVLFYKFQNQEIKKGSRLIIRPGQDAIFLYNGRVEGVFVEDGDYDIESDIIPFYVKEFQIRIQHAASGGGALYQYQGAYGEMGHEKCHQSAGARSSRRYADPGFRRV